MGTNQPETDAAELAFTTRLTRTLEVGRSLQRRDKGISLEELALRHNVDRTTARKDVFALELARVPIIETKDGRRMLYRIADDDMLLKLASLVSVTPILALVFATKTTAGRLTSSLAQSLEELTRRLTALVGIEISTRIHKMQLAIRSLDTFQFKNAPPDVIPNLLAAIVDGHVCKVHYKTAEPGAVEKVHEVLPQEIVTHRGAVYLDAYSPKHKDQITLNMHRVTDLEVTKVRAEPHKGFKLKDRSAFYFAMYTGGKQVTYRGIFSPKVAQKILERDWHSTQTVNILPDGRVELVFTCGESFEVDAWFAGWFDDVVVMGPPALQQRLGNFGRVSRRWYPKKRAYVFKKVARATLNAGSIKLKGPGNSSPRIARHFARSR